MAAKLIRRESLIGYRELIAELGGDLDDVLAASELTMAVLDPQLPFLRYYDYIVLLETAADVLNCNDFGLRLAAKQDIDILGPLALAAKQSTTLGDALVWVVSYIHFHAQGLEVTLTNIPHSNDFLLSFAITLNPAPKATQTIELTLALASQFANFLSDGQSKIKAVHMPHHYPAMSWTAKNCFGCAVEGNQQMAALVLDQDDLSMVVNRQQSQLANAAIGFLTNNCSPQHVSLTQQVALLIRAMLMMELCKNEVIASALGMGVRQLHRKLALEQTSFVKLKDRVRRELAVTYLRQINLPLGRIAELLGYQEQSALSKACVSWFGCSARQARYNLSDVSS